MGDRTDTEELRRFLFFAFCPVIVRSLVLDLAFFWLHEEPTLGINCTEVIGDPVDSRVQIWA